MNHTLSDEAERSAIATVVWSQTPALVMDALGEIGLADGDFRTPLFATVYAAAVDLCTEGWDDAAPLALADRLSKTGAGDWYATLSTEFPAHQALPSSTLYPACVARIRAAAAARRDLARARHVLALDDTGAEPGQIVATVDDQHAEREREKDRETRGPVELLKSVPQAMSAIARRAEGGNALRTVSTGYRELDAKLDGGWKPGGLYILAARPSVGKTALAVNFENQATLDDVPCLVDSLEMPAAQIIVRHVAISSGIPATTIKTGMFQAGEWERFLETTERLKASRTAIDDEGGMQLADLCRRARVWFRRNRSELGGLLIVDYLQLVTVPASRGGMREQEVSLVSRTLKATAKNLGIPILALCQLSRAAEASPRPKLSHLRESGAIEQDADVVMFLHRAQGEGQQQQASESELILAKNRDGETGVVPLWFDPPTNRFTDRRKVDDRDLPDETGHYAPSWTARGRKGDDI